MTIIFTPRKPKQTKPFARKVELLEEPNFASLALVQGYYFGDDDLALDGDATDAYAFQQWNEAQVDD